MTERQWKRLIRDIQEERCILMLGPRLGGVLAEEQWRPLVEKFSESLAQELVEEKVEFDQNLSNRLPYIAELFLRINGVERIDLEDEAKDYYQNHTKQIPPIYSLLANIPFSIVINTTFDDYMARAFNNIGKLSFSHYYNYKRKTDDEINPDAIDPQHPLVYNLFGSLSKRESLVLTDEDQLEFVRNVVKENPGLPIEILEQFDHSKSYLFLGFDLEHWQFRLLLESLNLKEGNATHSPKTGDYPLSITTKMIFENRFKFHFINKQGGEFMQDLLDRFEPQQQKEDKRVKKSVFMAYVDRDREFAVQLSNFLKPLIDNEEITLKKKDDLSFGVEVHQGIRDYIESSDVTLLLVSADFLADDETRTRELPLAIEQFKGQKATVIPIICRACDWRSNLDLSNLAPLPINGLPINSGEWPTRDDAYLHVVKYLKKRIWG